MQPDNQGPSLVNELAVYVISVATFKERHLHMNSQARKYGLPIEYIWTFDADALEERDLARFKVGSLPKPSVSAVLKHLEAQRRQLERKQPVCLVFEDDVILFDGFADKLERVLELAAALEPGWLIFLGGADNRIDQRFLRSRELSLIEQPISTAEAYLLDIEGCRRRLEWLEENLIELPPDHLLKALDADLGLRQYWVSEPMATQGSITGQFRTALDRSRRKHGSVYLMARYMYNRLRRQVLPRLLARFLR